jgi:poly(3-hydroxybutyrate) depolymerase
LCVNIPDERRAHWLQPEVGHYGVFNGSRFRAEIVPRISDFVLSSGAQQAGGGTRQSPRRKLAAGNGAAAPGGCTGAVETVGE